MPSRERVSRRRGGDKKLFRNWVQKAMMLYHDNRNVGANFMAKEPGGRRYIPLAPGISEMEFFSNVIRSKG